MGPNFARLPQGFSFHPEGRSGAILYRRGEHILELYWERSGSPEYDILISLDDLRTWKYPQVEVVSVNERNTIIEELRLWLAEKRLHTDVF